MPRIARVVIPGLAHHITQRGNRRQEVVFSDDDYDAYKNLMSEWCSRHGVAVWAYCLMPNHVHLIAVPESEDSLRLAIGEAHRRYTRRINFREGWRGHLWQERFASFAMDEGHLMQAARYVELNPVRAGLVSSAADYGWSSAAAHMHGRDDGLVRASSLLERYGDWGEFLKTDVDDEAMGRIRSHGRTGRPLGNADFVARLERMTGRVLGKRKPGRKRKRSRD